MGEDIWELWYRRGYYDAIHRLLLAFSETHTAAELLREYGYVILSDIGEEVSESILWLVEVEGIVVDSQGVIQDKPKC